MVSTPPMTAQEICTKVREKFPTEVLSELEFRGEYSLTLKAEAILPIGRYLRDELGFDYLIDISSVDHFSEEPRFEVVYELYGLDHGIHLRLKYGLGEDEPEGASVVEIWPGANWHEREIWDMMGIRFTNHPDLRRILMWEGYPYHPLRKDFPLEGKSSDVEEVAFTRPAPLEGGPFVTAPTDGTTQVREPRARHVGELPPANKFLSEP